MRKYGFIVFVAVLVASVFVLAMPFERVEVINTKGDKSFSIPEHAVELAPGVFSLGSALHEGRVVEGIAFVDYEKGYGKPAHAGEPKDKGGSTCYAFLANGAKWKSVEDWRINPENNVNLNHSFVYLNMVNNLDKWKNVSGSEIFGNGVLTFESLAVDKSSPDGVNEVYFGFISEPGAIAVTVVWGIFRGPRGQRELVEWDQVYDIEDYDWSMSGESGKMDFENIATHEVGHAAGMGHPSSDCVEETMYAYADFGETKKRDLNAGDIEGISDLYK